MPPADSTARVRPSKEAILRALERLAEREKDRPRVPTASGFFAAAVDEFASLAMLHREELDETDDDAV